MTDMTREEMAAKIRAAAPQGKITCAAAFKLADELGVSRAELGHLLNELKIKIINCQLGCF
ncbi:MAG: hypothetical protein WHT07_10770 [Desulfobaccales bacterium]